MSIQLKALGQALLTMLALLMQAVGMTLIGAPLLYAFYQLQGWIQLPQALAQQGLTQQAVWSDFMRIWTYLWQPWQGQLDLRHFSSSPGGLQHFQEVRQLILFALVGALCLSLLMIWQGRAWGQGWLYRRYLSQVQVLLLLVVGAGLCFFDQAFILFHKLFFANDLWLFDPRLDPIIGVLPVTYFMGLAGLMIVSYALLYWFWMRISIDKSGAKAMA